MADDDEPGEYRDNSALLVVVVGLLVVVVVDGNILLFNCGLDVRVNLFTGPRRIPGRLLFDDDAGGDGGEGGGGRLLFFVMIELFLKSDGRGVGFCGLLLE